MSVAFTTYAHQGASVGIETNASVVVKRLLAWSVWACVCRVHAYDVPLSCLGQTWFDLCFKPITFHTHNGSNLSKLMFSVWNSTSGKYVNITPSSIYHLHCHWLAAGVFCFGTSVHSEKQSLLAFTSFRAVSLNGKSTLFASTLVPCFQGA